MVEVTIRAGTAEEAVGAMRLLAERRRSVGKGEIFEAIRSADEDFADFVLDSLSSREPTTHGTSGE